MSNNVNIYPPGPKKNHTAAIISTRESPIIVVSSQLDSTTRLSAAPALKTRPAAHTPAASPGRSAMPLTRGRQVSSVTTPPLPPKVPNTIANPCRSRIMVTLSLYLHLARSFEGKTNCTCRAQTVFPKTSFQTTTLPSLEVDENVNELHP
jgi:hypothetical protein